MSADVDQITATVWDFEKALAGPVQCAFDGEWAEGEMAADVSALFDPAIGPLYDRANRVRQTARAHLANGTADLANVLRPEEGTHRVTEVVGDSDPLAVFAADPQTIYVLSDTPTSHTEGAIQSAWPVELTRDREGRRVFRLTDRLGSVLLGGDDGFVEAPGPLASVGQQFAHRVRVGTLPSACDLRLGARCGGSTAVIVQQVGLWLICWSTCAPCYRAAANSVEAAYRASVATALAAVEGSAR